MDHTTNYSVLLFLTKGNPLTDTVVGKKGEDDSANYHSSMTTPTPYWERITDDAYKHWLENRQVISEEFNSWSFDQRNETRAQFEQPQQQPSERRSIFTHGLPPLGPLSDTTKFTSNPFVPSDQQHAKAQVRIAKFSALSYLRGSELPYPETSIWTHVRRTTSDLGGYSN